MRRSILVAVLSAALSLATPGFAQDAAALHNRYAALHDRFENNAFGKPLVLESTQDSDNLKGDIHAVVEHPYAEVQQSLASIDHWCDILILHLNVKRCRVGAGRKVLDLSVGRKFDQPLEDAYALAFTFRVAASTPDYFQVLLSADEGPLSTKDYRIVVEAVPLDPRRTLVHMSYAYGYGFAAKLAMTTYLATLGRDKVGFTVTGRKDGKPVYIDGVLGLLERNTMRYYLAIDAYLGAAGLPPAEQAEKRIRDWYASTERYATQLHEMDQADYLDMKRKEMRRQQQS